MKLTLNTTLGEILNSGTLDEISENAVWIALRKI